MIRWLKLYDHWQIYNSLKHGNSLFYTVKPIEHWRERTFAVLCYTNLGHQGRVPIMLLNGTFYRYTYLLLQSVLSICLDLVDRAVWTVGAHTQIIELSFLYEPTDQEVTDLKNIVSSCVYSMSDKAGRPASYVSVDIHYEPPNDTEERVYEAYERLVADLNPGRLELKPQFVEMDQSHQMEK